MNFRLKNHHLCRSWKLYSSLNVTLTYFLDQSMNFIYQEEISFFPVDFLFDQWNQLRLMFFLLPFYTFHLESYLCHTNTGLLCMATGKQSSLTGAMQIHEVHEEEKPSNWPLLQGSRNQGEQEKILCCPFFGWKLGINHCSISLYHYIIKSS